ncbi:hypothetical protein [Peribacillus cavernae]|nr:hypothetical protein [Peribacillus cavernae]MDQ0220682.1 ABC-type molybdate transport system permease subunit [Peribacillus cavernae]
MIILGTIIAWLMVNKSFKGKIFVETIILLPLVLSPTVIGLNIVMG